MVSAEKVIEHDEVAQRFSHFLPVNGNHVVVDPVIYRLVAHTGTALGNFSFVMRKEQIQSSAVNVEFLAQVFGTHGHTFGVPTRETVAPGRRPAHNVFGLCLFPKSKIEARPFFILSVEFAGIRNQVFHFSAGELSIFK